MLTRDLLDGLERRWREMGVPWVDSLRPGLSGERIDALLEPFGYPLGDEARLWWGWHDGAAQDNAKISSSAYLLSLEVALGHYRMMRDVALDTAGRDGTDELIWPRRALPIFYIGGSDYWAVPCYGGPGADPVLWMPVDLTGGKAYPSLAALIEELCDAYDRGEERPDPTTGSWLENRARFKEPGGGIPEGYPRPPRPWPLATFPRG